MAYNHIRDDYQARQISLLISYVCLSHMNNTHLVMTKDLKTVAQGSNVVIFLSCIIKIIYLIMWMEESQILCVAFAAMPLHMYYANKTEEMIKC